MKSSRVIFFLVCFAFSIKGIAQDVITRAENIQSAILNTSDRSEILKYYGEIIQIVDSLDQNGKGFVDGRIYVWGLKSRAEYILGEHLQSEASTIKSLEILEKVENNDWRQEAKLTSYNQLGLLKAQLFDYKKAIEYYQKAIPLTDDLTYLSGIQSNIGLANYLLKEYRKAIVNYREALRLSENLRNAVFQARVLDNLGRAQSALDITDAESNLLKSLRMRDSLELPQEQISSHLHLSEYYLKNNEISKARQHAYNALEFANSSKLAELELAALENLFKLENSKNINKYVQLTDSLNKANLTNSNKFAEVRYRVAVKEREAQQLRLKNEYNTLIFVIITLIIILITVLLYYRIRQRNRLALIKESIKTENRISKKIHDEIANDLYHTMIKMDKEQLRDVYLIDEMDDIYRRVRDISNDNSPIDAESDFSTTIKDLLLSYKNEFTNITVLHLKTIDWSHLKLADKTNLYRVFQELLTNMKKHSNASQVLFSFDQIGKEINITYKDNGSGAELKKGNGLANMENRIQAIDGVITFETDKNEGFKATITI